MSDVTFNSALYNFFLITQSNEKKSPKLSSCEALECIYFIPECLEPIILLHGSLPQVLNPSYHGTYGSSSEMQIEP